MSVGARKIYSIADLVRETGIPTKQVNNLLEHHGKDIPFLMDGERRRFPPEAVPALLRLWQEYKKGIKEKKEDSAWFGETLDKIRDCSQKLAEVAGTLKEVQARFRANPPHRIFFVNSFPGDTIQPIRAIAVHVTFQGSKSRATLIDADLEAYGESDREAVLSLREVIIRTFLRLEQQRSEDEAEQFSVLSSLIKRRKE